jgi:hypothetical protein
VALAVVRVKPLPDVVDFLEERIRALDINTPADVVPLSGAVGGFRVDYQPHGAACDALASTTVTFYVSRADEASALRQAAQLQTDLAEMLNGVRGPWLSAKAVGSTVGDAVHAETRYVTVNFAVELWL